VDDIPYFILPLLNLCLFSTQPTEIARKKISVMETPKKAKKEKTLAIKKKKKYRKRSVLCFPYLLWALGNGQKKKAASWEKE
jgi:hypothetical protein